MHTAPLHRRLTATQYAALQDAAHADAARLRDAAIAAACSAAAARLRRAGAALLARVRAGVRQPSAVARSGAPAR
jgi:hypothetical protein